MAQAYWRVKRNGKWTFVPQQVFENGGWHRIEQPECECYYCNRSTIVMSLVPKDDEQSAGE